MTYEMIKKNFERGLWNEQMVKLAVQKGVITEQQYKEITHKTEDTVTCMQNTLNAITKTVIPNTAICPGWGNVTITPATTTTTTPAA